MKNILMILVVMSLLVAGTAFGQGVKGQMAVGAYGGYTIGMGDVFDDYELLDVEFSTSAGINFGGHFHYGLGEKIMIGGEVMMQSYKFESSGELLGVSFDESESETKLNFMATALYAMNMDDKKAFFLTAGVGFYDFGDTEIGFNGGFMYRQMVSPTVGLYLMPRIHLVMAEDMFELIQISGGIQIPFGKK
jgi:opacity protein-like surface antigen